MTTTQNAKVIDPATIDPSSSGGYGFTGFPEDKNTFSDRLTKSEAIDRLDGLCEKALEAIDQFLVMEFGDEAAIELMAGSDMPARFAAMIPSSDRLTVIKNLWNARESICGNSAFMEVID